MVYFMWGQPPTKNYLAQNMHSASEQGVENRTKTHYDETESVSFTKLKKSTFKQKYVSVKIIVVVDKASKMVSR